MKLNRGVDAILLYLLRRGLNKHVISLQPLSSCINSEALMHVAVNIIA